MPNAGNKKRACIYGAIVAIFAIVVCTNLLLERPLASYASAILSLIIAGLVWRSQTCHTADATPNKANLDQES